MGMSILLTDISKQLILSDQKSMYLNAHNALSE